MVHESVKSELLNHMIRHIKSMYGDNPKKSKFYARIVHETAMNRLINLLKEGKLIYGGISDKSERYISPTIIDLTSADALLMQEEIFGPILPVLSFLEIDEATNYINSQEKPLALYYFDKNKKAKEVLQNTTSGGGCINNTLLHVANHHLPFGGVGNSGMGRYHGKESFMAFSNHRAIVKAGFKSQMRHFD